MPIRIGDHPSTDPPETHGHNKFLGFGSEGHRGIVAAIRQDRKQAVIIAYTQSVKPEDGIRVGEIFLVAEDHPDHYPRAVAKLTSLRVPDQDESLWHLPRLHADEPDQVP